MATRKTDSFFIRKSINLGSASAYVEDSIDLGAFVDALGEAVLRIHNIAVSYGKADGMANTIGATNTSELVLQLTTQTQDSIVLASDKSVIASGKINAVNVIDAAEIPAVYEDLDHLPQHWTNGVLVGVEQIYLAGECGTNWVDDMYLSIVMECTVEKLTKAAALALALSQQ